jgi:hypothetical protein
VFVIVNRQLSNSRRGNDHPKIFAAAGHLVTAKAYPATKVVAAAQMLTCVGTGIRSRRQMSSSPLSIVTG